MPRAKKPDRERGAALVTVLVMLSIMSTLAIVAVDAAQFSLRRTQNQAGMEQARWYLMGAESFAAGRIEEMAQRAATLRLDQSEWQGREITLPLEGGVMDVALWDGSNCFNLNSLVEKGDGGAYVMSGRGFVQFARLLDVLDIRSTSGGGLAPPLVDWLDSDDMRSAGGAEAESYAGAGAPYQAANALMADVSELARVRGFSDDVIARLAPYVCVRPDAAPSIINPNTLRLDQAPLLTMALGSQFNLAAAQDLIERRPRGGWATIEEFFAAPRFAGLELNDAVRGQFSLSSRYYVMTARVQMGDASETSAALIELSGRARVIRRLYGAGAAGRAL
jgi:general secretion pathway protein K